MSSGRAQAQYQAGSILEHLLSLSTPSDDVQPAWTIATAYQGFQRLGQLGRIDVPALVFIDLREQILKERRHVLWIETRPLSHWFLRRSETPAFPNHAE